MAVLRLRKPVFSPQSIAAAAALAFCFAFVMAPAWGQEAVPAPEPAALPLGIHVIDLKGRINSSVLPMLRKAFDAVDPDRFPAGALVLLNSPGGDANAAMEIGRMARAAKAHVFVRGVCASACVYILAGGVVRGVAPDRSVDIHRGRLTTFVKGIGVVDINPASNPNAAKALEISDRRVHDFLLEMSLPDTLFKAIMGTPADQMRHLSFPELADFGLTAMDPAYRAIRAPAGAEKYGIPEEEFVRRTLLVAEKCLGDKSTPREIGACYRRLLRTGE